ncbi:hypothetical protein [Acutalibacter caecimuris]|uniref:hypothetical protein n=1 Tax=Acutalibacter caecimuris TaxID=3093657 RepID=UPI002AC90E24|nr:hypothetical protein [Acutalibacter sp. M00118]
MCKTELEILERQVRKRRIDVLVDRGVIKPVRNFSEYSSAIQKAKQNATHRLFTNSYMLRDEVERLIGLNLLYLMSLESGAGFVEDQRAYWRLHLHIDLERRLQIHKLERSILIELVYAEGRMTNQQEKFRQLLSQAVFSHFYETYRACEFCNKMSKAQYDTYHRTIQKVMEKEGTYICAPDDEQLLQFERIYRERIDLYSQSFYTLEERKQQRDRGLVRVLVDKKGEVLAIWLNNSISGGAVAAKSGFASNIYVTALFIDALKDSYNDEGKMISPSRPQGYGWIATRNTESIRVHDMFGIKWTGRAFDQFIIPGYVC